MQKWKQQAAPYAPLLFIHYIQSLNTWIASLLQTNLQIENFPTWKVHLHVQSHQLVHRSDAYCHGHILDKWVCFCVFYCTELYGQQQVLVAQSGLTLCNPMNCSPPGSTVHEIFSSKGTGVHCRFLLQGIFATRGLNMGLLHCRQILYWLSYEGSWWSTIVQYFYFKPAMSERKHKCSGNLDDTTILFLKVCLVAQLHSTLATYGL